MFNVVGMAPNLKENKNGFKLIKKMLDENLVIIEPVIDTRAERGFYYPQIESLLGLSTDDVILLMESLANTGILNARLSDKLQACVECGSCYVEPVEGCPRCGSVNIDRGRILEHLKCGYLGLENEYMQAAKYACPKCKMELKYLFTDYQSVGVKYKCSICSYIFDSTASLMKCFKCNHIFSQIEARDVFVYAYELGEEQRDWLQFEIGPREHLIEFLKARNYDVLEQARVGGVSKSGAAHYFNMIAYKNNGFMPYTVCIDIAMNTNDEDVGLDEVFKFDNKAYDLNIQNKVLLVIPRLDEKAKHFAERQGIRVYENGDLELFLNSAPFVERRFQVPENKEESVNTREKLVQVLTESGYEVAEDTTIKGRSGVEHNVDIYARSDDGFMIHTIIVGILDIDKEIGLEQVMQFDTRAFDIGVQNKILLVNPVMDIEANKFAEYQRIRVIEIDRSGK